MGFFCLEVGGCGPMGWAGSVDGWGYMLVWI